MPELGDRDRYYIPTRYPNGLPEGGQPSEAFDVDDAQTAIATAEQVATFASGALASLQEASESDEESGAQGSGQSADQA